MINYCFESDVDVSLCTDNIALYNPAWQRHPYSVGGSLGDAVDASNAVDGRKSDLGIRGGQCVISANTQQTATWRVDLEGIRSIHHITIYYRTENKAWGK
jgi:hypothetical protein